VTTTGRTPTDQAAEATGADDVEVSFALFGDGVKWC
jgi:hypothetical protein